MMICTRHLKLTAEPLHVFVGLDSLKELIEIYDYAQLKKYDFHLNSQSKTNYVEIH